MADKLSDLECEQIDRHFQSAELSRQWGPSGIYWKVQRYIDTDLQADLERYKQSHRPWHEDYAETCRCGRRWPCVEAARWSGVVS